MSEPRIGVFICACGGNISDFVDIENVKEAITKEPGVISVSTAMFTCSDATQQEIINTIKEKNLDGIVVASCSPKLHLNTFRAAADRAKLNRYRYNQVNIREQCSWTHTHDIPAATQKAIALTRAGVARTRLSKPLEDIRIKTAPRVLVVGAGVAGLRASLSLAELGLEIHLVERAERVGGQVAKWGTLFPSNRDGRELVKELAQKVEAEPRITLYLNSHVSEKRGSVGDFNVTIASNENFAPENTPDKKSTDKKTTGTQLQVGTIMVTTGYKRYTPKDGEFGHGLPGVVTLDQFHAMIESNSSQENSTRNAETIQYQGHPIRSVAYIYCVGSRQTDGCEGCHSYCSRYCCSAAVHTSLLAGEKDPGLRQFHLYRDMRTYGKQELIYDKVLRQGSMFLKVPDDQPPTVEQTAHGLKVLCTDQLTSNEKIELPVDLVVLVTGMEAPQNKELVDTLKLPVGLDGFYNEIHPKLRPVETVMDGVMIAGAAQGPKNLPESVASGMAAAAKTAALLLKGYIDLEPFIATVNPKTCSWCGECAAACTYGAIGETQGLGKDIAAVNPALCKGCGACVPACETKAIAVEGYTHAQVESMIDVLAQEVS